MASNPAPRVRRSILDIQRDYENGNKTELENLMRAWQGIKALDPTDLNSFFMVGGYHGEPFRGPGATDPEWWGGYCQHATVLFPSWHRAYLYRLEEALRSIPGCGDVTLPFWDECSTDTQNNGIPSCLTDEKFFLDGQWIPNPLRSYIFQVDIVDLVPGVPGDPGYSKAAGYETVRYPLSGLVGTPEQRAATAAHNAKFPSAAQNTLLLNANVSGWLTTPITIPQPGGKPFQNGLVLYKFAQCLDAPNYTLFSNTTSQRAWNAANKEQVVALETPHNAIHLAVGGFDVPGAALSLIPGANGDMGENETAGLDPIFFFHHCFIDYTFWTWQRRHGATDQFDIDENDPGASYSLKNGPAPPAGVDSADLSQPMTLDTPLRPFPSTDGERIMITRETINIERDLGYTYGPGSLDVYAQAPAKAALAAAAPDDSSRIVHVAGLNRAKIKGSFAIAAYAEVDGVRRLIDVDPVLSRWSVEGCANCQAHLEATADFRVPAEIAKSVEVRVHTRGGVLGGAEASAEDSAGFVKGIAPASGVPFTVEIR